jgi:MATE family multidrug resistance protein
MMIVMVGSVGCVFLPTWFLLRETGNHALWAALLAFMAVRSIGMHVWYRRMLRDGRLIGPAATN